MKKHLILGLAAVSMLASCSGEGDAPVSAAAPRFSATIQGRGASRAFDTSWEAGDAVGISGTSGAKVYANVKYTTDGSGDFSPAASDIYFQDNSPVTFTAYYPFADDPSAITADTRAQQAQKSFDFLWAQAQGSKAQPDVPFVFGHRMSKLVLTVCKGADVDFAEVKEAVLSLGGLRTGGTFDAAAGVAAAAGDAAAAWTFANNTADASFNAPVLTDAEAETVTYTLILFPQDFAAPVAFEAQLPGRQAFKAGLDFTAANRNAGDATPANAWLANRQYTLSVTLHKTALTVEGCTIAPWDNAESGNIDAN